MHVYTDAGAYAGLYCRNGYTRYAVESSVEVFIIMDYVMADAICQDSHETENVEGQRSLRFGGRSLKVTLRRSPDAGYTER